MTPSLRFSFPAAISRTMGSLQSPQAARMTASVPSAATIPSASQMQIPQYFLPRVSTRKGEGTAQKGLAAQILPSFGARISTLPAASCRMACSTSVWGRPRAAAISGGWGTRAVSAASRKTWSRTSRANASDAAGDSVKVSLHLQRSLGKDLKSRVPPNGSRLSCGRLPQRRKVSGRQFVPARAQTSGFH